MESLLISSFNLLILIGFLVYKLRAPTKDYVAQRHLSIRDEIRAVHQQLKEAQEKYDEFSAKLKAIDAEVSALREQTKQETLALKQRMASDARRMASIVVSDAKRSADALFFELKGQLYSELSHRVLDRAEVLIKDRLTGDDRNRICREFSQQVEGAR